MAEEEAQARPTAVAVDESLQTAPVAADPEIELLTDAEIEERGWVIVHEGPWQADFRAEKYLTGDKKVEQAGTTKENLLKAITYYETFQDRVSQPQTPPEVIAARERGDAARAAAEGDPEAVAEVALTVTAPDGTLLTEEEWSLRDSGYEIADKAQEEREERSQAEEDELKGEPEPPESETIVTSSQDQQPEDTLLVRPGEESLADVDERKQEEAVASEAERGETNTGIGPHGPVEGPAPEGPMGGEPESYDPGPGLSETELAKQQEVQAEIDQAVQMRDEGLPEREVEKGQPGEAAAEAGTTDEQAEADAEAQRQAEEDARQREEAAAAAVDVGPVSPADSADAAAGVIPPASGQETAEQAPPATDAAQELAAQEGIDLSTVEGTGAEGKITKPDVQAAVDEQAASDA